MKSSYEKHLDKLITVLNRGVRSTLVKNTLPYMLRPFLNPSYDSLYSYYDQLLVLINDIDSRCKSTIKNSNELSCSLFSDHDYTIYMRLLSDFIENPINDSNSKMLMKSIRDLLIQTSIDYIDYLHGIESNRFKEHINDLYRALVDIRSLSSRIPSLIDLCKSYMKDLKRPLNNDYLDTFIRIHNTNQYKILDKAHYNRLIFNLNDLYNTINRLYHSKISINITLECDSKNIYVSLSYNSGNDILTIPLPYMTSLNTLIASIIRDEYVGKYTHESYLTYLYEPYSKTHIRDVNKLVDRILVLISIACD